MLATPQIRIEPFQKAAWKALGSSAQSVLIYGGAGSGKTHLIVLWLVMRALLKPAATHALLRYRFNHLRASIIEGTLPEVCGMYWPGQTIYDIDKTAWFAEFIGGGRIWFGGLDDKNRTEKILGQSHSTIYINEASQVSYSARVKATTRLRQNRGLALKEVCDENPPMSGHWTQRLWIGGIEPATGGKLGNPEQYAWARMNPRENPHIPESYKERLRNYAPRDRQRFWDGEWGTSTDNPLWTYESVEQARLEDASPEKLPSGITQIVVAVDPSGCHGPEDERSDEVGIVVVGLGAGGTAYVLEDASGRFGPSGKEGWAVRVCALFHKWGADRVVCETNFGGAMVKATIQTADANVPVKEITASRAKHVRAEPVSQLFAMGKAFLCGSFPELEAQLVQFSSAGYQGDKSPDRADAMIWGVYALGIVRMPGQAWLDMAGEGVKVKAERERGPGAAAPEALVSLVAPPERRGTFYSRKGNAYSIEAGQLHVRADEVDDMLGLGFRRAST